MRFDLTTREWHELLKPVIPHASTDADSRELAVIRIETGTAALYAIATDRVSLAAERRYLPPQDRSGWGDMPPPVHVKIGEAKASLALFQHSKDADPPMRITIDTVAVPVVAVGRHTTIIRYAITLETGDGTRLVMHDQRDSSNDPLAGWRDILAVPLVRPAAESAPALNLKADMLGRWAAACRKGERLAMFTGRKGTDLVLIAVESHFLGAWHPQSYLESPREVLEDSPWHDELVPDAPDGPPHLATIAGVSSADVKQRADGTTETTIHVDGLFQQPVKPDSTLGPWITASYSSECAGCGGRNDEGEQIRADGEGGWLCSDCGTGDDTGEDTE